MSVSLFAVGAAVAAAFALGGVVALRLTGRRSHASHRSRDQPDPRGPDTRPRRGAPSPPLERMGAKAPPVGLAREDRDAVNRLALLHGPLERRSAMLALLMRRQPPGPLPIGRPAAQLAVWRREALALTTADRVLADVQALSDAARLPWFEKLLERTKAAPQPERDALVDSATRLLGAGGEPDRLERLYLQVTVLLLRPAPVLAMPSTEALRGAPSDADTDVELLHLPADLVGAVGVVTALVDGLAPRTWGWRAGVMSAWPEQWSGVGSTWPGDQRLADALARLRMLPLLLRPTLMRWWVGAAAGQCAPAQWPGDFRDALRLLSLALDCPRHPDIERFYVTLDGIK